MVVMVGVYFVLFSFTVFFQVPFVFLSLLIFVLSPLVLIFHLSSFPSASVFASSLDHVFFLLMFTVLFFLYIFLFPSLSTSLSSISVYTFPRAYVTPSEP